MEGNRQPVATEGKHKFEDGSAFNLKWLVSTVLAIWPWLLGSIIIALIIGNLYLRYTTPYFKSSAELLISDSKASSGGNDALDVLKLNNNKINIDNEIEIIKSRTTMQKVVAALHLNVSYSVLGRLKTTEVYANKPFEFVIADSTDGYYSCKVNVVSPEGYELIEGNGKKIHGKWGDTISVALGKVMLRKTAFFNLEKIQYTINVQTIQDAAMSYSVSVYSVGKGASYVTLSMVDALPERSVDIINKLMEVYGDINVQNRNRISDSTISFITKRIVLVDTDLTLLEKGIQYFKQSHGIADMGAQSEQLVDANSTTLQNLADAEVELYKLSAISDFLAKADDKSIILPASMLSNAGVSTLMEKFNNIQLQIENSEIANTRENPTTRTLIKQKDEIKQNIIASLASSKHEVEAKVDKIKSELSNISSDIRKVPIVERQYLQFDREQKIKQEIFTFLLKKREETAIEKAATVANATPIDPALAGGVPVMPNHSRVLMLSFLFGTIVPFGIIMLRRGLNIKIINKSDILKLTTIPIIGEIGNNLNGDNIAVKKNSRTIVSEQFRALRTNLQYLLTDKKDKILMITSSMSGEGKSFIAINLSITLAMSGKKVVLMELDLRKPKISKALKMENNLGFSSYAIGKAEYSDIIVPSGIDPGLFIVNSGPIPPNPSEIILLQRTEDLFNYLRAHFDYVIIDTSPLGLVTDAQLIHKYVDTTLYIVRQGHTYKQQLNIPNELYYSGKITRLSLIINDVIANRGFAYGYGYEEGYGYGYGYGYSYGYYAEEKKKGIRGLFGSKGK